ncbi:hypothetical protein [Streptomyces sp. NPDC017941]|uniref:hypothetical protein n=1 Tax=Streptomyces sp. NPDC017941 TaxID=3365018 RepID=UPI00379D860C
MNPVDEVRSAITRLHTMPPATMTPPLRQALDELLTHTRTTALELCRLRDDSGGLMHVHPHALAIAQAINQTSQTRRPAP